MVDCDYLVVTVMAWWVGYEVVGAEPQGRYVGPRVPICPAFLPVNVCVLVIKFFTQF